MKRILQAHSLRFLWGLVIGMVLLMLWTLHVIFEENRAITTLCAGGSYDLVFGGMYLLWLSQERIEPGRHHIRFRNIGYVVAAMVGGIIPFVVTHQLGLRN